MNANGMLQELETAAEKLGVAVSYESLAASVGLGGLCRVKGQYRVIIDKRASGNERIATLAEALARVGVDAEVELSTAARDRIRFYAMRNDAMRNDAMRNAAMRRAS